MSLGIVTARTHLPQVMCMTFHIMPATLSVPCTQIKYWEPLLLDLFVTDIDVSKIGATSSTTNATQGGLLQDHSSHPGASPMTRNPQRESQPHYTTFTTGEAAQEVDPPVTDTEAGSIYLHDIHTGKRLTRKPLKYCSPFKAGIMSHPPPNVDASMSLLDHLCADNSLVSRYVGVLFNSRVVKHTIFPLLIAFYATLRWSRLVAYTSPVRWLQNPLSMVHFWTQNLWQLLSIA